MAQRLVRAEDHFDILGHQAFQQFPEVVDEGVDIQYFRLQRLLPAERKHLPRERSGAVRGFANLLAAHHRRIAGGRAVDNQFAVALDDRQQVVEIVSHAAGQAPQRFHFLRLAKLTFELLLLRFVFLQRIAHAIERASGVGQFIAAVRVERVPVITTLECAESAEKLRQRPRECVRNHEREPSAGNHRDETKSEQQMVQLREESRFLTIGFQHREARDRPGAAIQPLRIGKEFFVANLDRAGRRDALQRLARFRFLDGAEGARDNVSAVGEGDLAV